MPRFYVYSPVWSQDYRCIWEESGFIPVSDLSQCGEQPPDVMVLDAASAQLPELWQSARAVRAKTVIIADTVYHDVPAEVGDIYTQQHYQGDTVFFTLATRLEGLVPEPVWDMYRTGGELSEALQHKIIADTLYRYLLKDVLRETFEWCGHTFSVLGPA